MSIAEAFEGVVPPRPVSPAPAGTRPARTVPARTATRRTAKVHPLRRVGRVMWLDAADSWIVRDSSPAPAAVWHTDYTAHLDNPPTAYVAWCRVYRLFAVIVGAALDGLKVLLIHPVRGPLTVIAGFLLIVFATH